MKKVIVKYAPLSFKENRKAFDNLYVVLECGLNLLRARDALRKEFAGGIECNVQAGSLGGDELYPGFTVEFKGDNSHLLAKAISKYFASAGTPHYIAQSDDFSTLKNILGCYGLKPHFGFLRYLGLEYRIVEA